MDRSDVIKLISVFREQDPQGIWKEHEKSREVYCQVHSIRRDEFFQAGRNGLNPSYEFKIFSYDYHNEEIVEYNGFRYAVYRTYLRDDDYLEVYVERKGGTNGEKDHTGPVGCGSAEDPEQIW